MTRRETLGHYFELDGVELFANPEVDLREWQWLVNEILDCEPIPEPQQREYEHEDYYE